MGLIYAHIIGRNWIEIGWEIYMFEEGSNY